MNKIENSYKSYKAAAYGPSTHLTKLQAQEIKRAFFAGACGLFGILMIISKPSDLQTLQDEILAFSDRVSDPDDPA